VSWFIVKYTGVLPISGTYRRVVVLEVEDDVKEVRHDWDGNAQEGVLREVAAWEGLWVGASKQCAFEMAMEEAHEMAADLNAPLQRLASVATAWDREKQQRETKEGE
jgi:hypothetical protein